MSDSSEFSATSLVIIWFGAQCAEESKQKINSSKQKVKENLNEVSFPYYR